MTLAAIIFGFLVSTLMGAVFHLWKNGGFGRLLLYLILAWAGFWAGHWLGERYNLTFISIGPLRFGMALLVGAVILYAGYWLSLVRQEAPKH